MPEIIKIPQRKIVTRSVQPQVQPQVPVEYKIVSESNYTSNGEKLIIAKDIDETVIILDSTKNQKITVKVLTKVRVLPDLGKIDEEWDELQLDWGACVQFQFVEGNWYILSSDGLKMS
jgi:hypothetical protein